MPKLSRILGKELIKILEVKSFSVIRQKSSHVRLSLTKNNFTYFITVPLHNEIDRGTLKNIIRSLEKCMSQEEIKKLFYS